MIETALRRRGLVLVLFFSVVAPLSFNSQVYGQDAIPNEYIIRENPRIQARLSANARFGNYRINDNKLLGKRSAKGDFRLVRATPEGQDPQNFCQQLQASTGATCSPNYPIRTSSTPDDEHYQQQYGPSSLMADAVWEVQTGSSDTIVAVIDTGIDYTHPDLAENVWLNPFEIAGNGLDDDQNGYVDDVSGFDFVNDDPDPYDDHDKGHGTHVSGILGARGNNAVGVAGVNWDISMIPLKVLDENGEGSTASAVAAINYLTDLKQRHNLNIILSNNSWGGSSFSPVLYLAIADAMQAGILFIAAAGNDGQWNDQHPTYPANYDLSNIISVANIDDNENLVLTSNYGFESVDIAAPGSSILSARPVALAGLSYKTKSGTSMAAPHVAGAIALLHSQYPDLSVWQLKQTLFEQVKKLNTLTNLVATEGKPNLEAMFANPYTAPVPTPTPALPPVEPDPTIDSDPKDKPSPDDPIVDMVPDLRVYGYKSESKVYENKLFEGKPAKLVLSGMHPSEKYGVYLRVNKVFCPAPLLSQRFEQGSHLEFDGKLPKLPSNAKANIYLSSGLLPLKHNTLRLKQRRIRGTSTRSKRKWNKRSIKKVCRGLTKSLRLVVVE